LNINHAVATDGCIDDLNKLSNLKTMFIRQTRISGAALGNLKVLPELQALTASETSGISTVLKKMVDSQIVKYLEVDQCDLTDSDMKMIGTMSNLENLKVNGNTQVTDLGLKSIGGLRKLQILAIGGTRISSGCSAALSKLSRLKILSIDWNNWRSEDRDQLSKALPKCSVQSPNKSAIKSLVKEVRQFDEILPVLVAPGDVQQ
jgi:hypothetical protein